jgi:hypothetical protein
MKRTILSAAVLAFAAYAAAAPLGSKLPDATPEEQALYAEIENNPAEVNIFVATRSYVREHAKNPSARMPESFTFRYTIGMAEQVKFFKVAIAQGFKKSLG